jgi:hypothetical protein
MLVFQIEAKAFVILKHLEQLTLLQLEAVRPEAKLRV